MTASSRHSLTLSYTLSSGNVPEDPYWLTFEQQGVDDGATLADAAAVVDALYNINICVDTSTQGVDQSSPAIADPQTAEEISAMRDKLLGVSKDKMSIDACKVDTSGDYQAEIKICCSHPDIPYALRLSTTGGILAALGDPNLVKGLPEVLQTVRRTEIIAVTLDVKNASSIVLPSPVIQRAASASVVMSSGYTPSPIPGNLTASWRGSPIPTGIGQVDTTIRALHNTLYWDGNVTGTIIASYQTMYDLVTVSVPGIVPTGSEAGKTQNATILAFYHGQVYPGSITAPTADSSVDDPTRDAICNPTRVSGVTLTPPEDRNYPDKSEYGCELTDAGLANRELYKSLCCHYPTGELKTCAEKSEPLPAKQLSEEDKKNMLAAQNFGIMQGTVSFVAIPPCGTEGCGKRITRVSLQQHNCCLEWPEMNFDIANSVSVLAPGQSGFVFITGGVPPYYWKIRGYGFSIMDDYRRECYTDVPFVRVYAHSMACGSAPITVSDECVEVSYAVRSSVGRWVTDYLQDCGIYGKGSILPWNGSIPILFAGVNNTHQGPAYYGQYKVEQTFESVSCPSLGTKTYAEVLADCQYLSQNPCSNVSVVGTLNGSLFSFPPTCTICGQCTDPFMNSYLFAPGPHTTIYPNDYGYYSMSIVFGVVSNTKISKWIC